MVVFIDYGYDARFVLRLRHSVFYFHVTITVNRNELRYLTHYRNTKEIHSGGLNPEIFGRIPLLLQISPVENWFSPVKTSFVNGYKKEKKRLASQKLEEVLLSHQFGEEVSQHRQLIQQNTHEIGICLVLLYSKSFFEPFLALRGGDSFWALCTEGTIAACPLVDKVERELFINRRPPDQGSPF